MLFRPLLLLALLPLQAIACHPPAGTGSHPGGSAGPGAPFASAPPLATPGEHMTYKVALGGIDLATYELAVGDITDLDGKPAIVVQGHAKAAGLVKIVANIDDRFTSYIDTTTGRPLKFLVDEYATKSDDVEHTVVSIAARSGASVPVEFHINDAAPTPEPQTVSLPDVWDYNSFLVALRAWEAPPGTKITAEVFRSRYLWHVDMTIGDKTKLVTELGELPALRIDGHTYKVDRTNKQQAGSDARDFSVWISDDAARVPLKINTRTDYGDVAMTIVDYAGGK